MRTLIRRWLPEAVLALGIIILFHPLFLGEVIFWGTPMLQFYPWREAAFSRLRSGELPLWNSMLGNGAPLLANYQTAVFYPPNWLYLLIPTEYAMGLVGILHLLWAGLGVMTYVRSLGVDRLGQGIGALAYALSGYLIARFGFLSITSMTAWLPWLIWAAGRVLLNQDSHSRWRNTAVLAATTSMVLLAGHAQTAFYCLALAAIYVLWRAITTYDLRAVAAPLAHALMGVIIGIALAAAQLAPTLELMQSSQRAGGLEREMVMTYSFWPWRFLTLLSPNMFGSPATGDYWGYANYWEDAIYVGLLTLVLVIRSVRRWLAERQSASLPPAAQVVPFYAALLVPVFGIALGKNTPIFPWLYDHLPGFNIFQAPTRITLLAVFGLAVLAAVGADQWHATARGVSGSRRWLAVGISILLGALYARFLLPGIVQDSFIRGAGWLGMMVVLIASLFLALRRIEWQPRWRPWWEAAALVLLAGDLIVAHWGLNPTIPATYYHQTSELAQALFDERAAARTLYLPEDEYEAKFTHFLSFETYQAGDLAHWEIVRESLLPNLGMIDGIPSANNFDPLLVGSYSALLQSLSDLSPDQQIEAARRMNVGVLLSTEQRSNSEPFEMIGPIYAYRTGNPWPRTSLADCTSEGDEWRCEPRDADALSILVDEPERIVVTVSADAPDYLLLLDTYYPGWEARLDDQPVAIQRANGAFRAISTPPGVHEITFLYRPRSLYVGLALTGIGIILTAVLWLWRPRSAPV